MALIVYPVVELEENESGLRVKAKHGNEVFTVFVPKIRRDFSKITFAVTSIHEKDEEKYFLDLHSHEGDCCELDTELIVEKALLKKWTGLTGKEIENAFRGIRIGATYNMLACMPRKIMIEPATVTITLAEMKKVPTNNSCSLIFQDIYPADGKRFFT